MQLNHLVFIIFVELIGIVLIDSQTVRQFLINEFPNINLQSMFLDPCGRDRVLAITRTLNCPDCLDRQLSDLSQPEVEFIQKELLKQKILQKLHLDAPPCINQSIPKPPTESILAAVGNLAENSALEATYHNPKTIQKVLVFVNNDDFSCPENSRVPCTRFQFQLLPDSDLKKLLHIELWLHNSQRLSPNNISIQIFNNGSDCVEHIYHYPFFFQDQYHFNTLGISSDWLRYIVYVNATTTLPLYLDVEVNGIQMMESSVRKSHLVVHLEDQNILQVRNRRSMTCRKQTTICCKESLYINFADLGWDEWVIHPKGYYASFCKGTCVHDISQNRNSHAYIISSFIQRNRTAAASLGLKMCCSPSKMAPLSMVYVDKNKIIHPQSLINMQVVECDCA